MKIGKQVHDTTEENSMSAADYLEEEVRRSLERCPTDKPFAYMGTREWLYHVLPPEDGKSTIQKLKEMAERLGLVVQTDRLCRYFCLATKDHPSFGD